MFINRLYKMIKNNRQSKGNMLREITSAYTDIGWNEGC